MPDEQPVEPITPPETPPSPIFFGPHGLRSGWGLLIALVLIFVLFPASTALLRMAHLVPRTMGHSAEPSDIFLFEFMSFVVVALMTWIMAKLEGRPLGIYGLGGTAKLKHLALGAVAGIVAISLLVVTLVSLHLLVIDHRLLFGGDALRYALLWLPGFLAIGLFEEYLFRGYLQFTLARGFSGLAPRLSPRLNPQTFGFWTAAFIVSFGFGAVHGSNPGESPAGLICAGLAALLFCFSLWRTGSLWWAVGMHAAWDYGQSFVFGVADSGTMINHRLLATHPVGTPLLSGGATGPEGSVLCLPVLLLLVLLVYVTQQRPALYAAQMPHTATPPAPPTEEQPALSA